MRQPDTLSTVLEEIQDHYSYLLQQGLQYAAHELGFPLSRVYGVATFYNLFQLSPPGCYLVVSARGRPVMSTVQRRSWLGCKCQLSVLGKMRPRGMAC